jgi:hypothetical protein
MRVFVNTREVGWGNCILLVFPQILWVVYNKFDEPMMFWRLVLVNGKYE